MSTDTFDLSRPTHATIRADQPTVVEVSPAVTETLIAGAGSIFMAIVGVGFALYLMLPFGS